MTPSESRLLKLRTEIIALVHTLPLGTPGQVNPAEGPGRMSAPLRDVGAIKDIPRLAPMAQPGSSDYPVASGPVTVR